MKLQWNSTDHKQLFHHNVHHAKRGKDLLISHARIFVEESFFDVCKIMVDEDGIIREGSQHRRT